MNPRKPIYPPARTILSDIPPLSEAERAQLKKEQEQHRKEWFRKTVDILLTMASHDQQLARDLCKRTADAFGPDDELGPLMQGRLRVDRKGKGRGRHRQGRHTRWTHVDYIVLLIHYALQLEDGRDFALKWLSEKEGISEKKVEGRITKARDIVSPDDLPEWAHSALYPPKLRKRGSE